MRGRRQAYDPGRWQPVRHAALARLAEQRGEAALAQTARGRCETMAGDRRICRGDDPRPPLLRGRPLGYALPGAIALVARVQRGLFLRAVERERVPGFALRPATSEDGRVPALRSLFTSSERVLEQTPDAAYGEPARVAVLRVVPRSRTAVVLVAVTLAVLALSASLTLRAA